MLRDGHFFRRWQQYLTLTPVSVGAGAWGAAAGAAADAGLVTLIQAEGEVLSYELTDPGKINAAYLGNKFTQLTVATALGAGLGWIGSVMSSQLRSNYKVLANSPNSLNPLRYKIVQPIVNPKSARLMSSLADSTGGGILNHAGGELLTAGGKRIELPATASLTVQEALDWQHAMSEGLESMLNRDASLYEHARQALQLKNDLTAIARNAMDDANAAAQLSMIMPERTFEEMRFARTKGYAGNTMYRQMIADASEELRAVRSVTEPGGCFVAGTLVHTRDGLKRIEDIRVGDWVLSQPEETG
ncbi:MAG: hypothetical protein JNJ60_22000, partial [Rhodocyclaceae bacterium]|nr:hypothetical protein [Rhodocyclaceae bacterium]